MTTSHSLSPAASPAITPASRPLKRRLMAACLCAAGLLPLPFAMTPVHAAGLAALIDGAVQKDPAVLEALAREEQAQMQTQVSRSGHWLVLGVQAQEEFDKKYKDLTNPDPVALTGRLNLFSAGAVSSRVERDQFHEKFYNNKTAETQENLATTMAQHYLDALRNKELLETEQANLKRHDKIIGDLDVIVRHDPGRNYELVQAQSRALQVRMRMVRYEKAMRLSLSKLTRYTDQQITLANPFGPEWRKAVRASADGVSHHPSIQAQYNSMQATRAELDNLRKSRWPSVDLVVAAGRENRSTRVVLNWNFLDRGAYYSQQSAAKQLTAAQNRVDLLQREIDERTQTAEADMAQSKLQAAAAEQQISASRQVVDLYEMQFRIARRSLLDVLNAYAELANVEVSRVVAENDYRNAVASYLDANASLADWARLATTGRLPERRSLTLPEGTGAAAKSAQPEVVPQGDRPMSGAGAVPAVASALQAPASAAPPLMAAPAPVAPAAAVEPAPVVPEVPVAPAATAPDAQAVAAPDVQASWAPVTLDEPAAPVAPVAAASPAVQEPVAAPAAIEVAQPVSAKPLAAPVAQQSVPAQPAVAEAAPVAAAPLATAQEAPSAPVVVSDPAPATQAMPSEDMVIGVKAFAPAPAKTVEQAAASPDDVPEALEAPEGEFKPILTSAPLSPEFRDAP